MKKLSLLSVTSLCLLFSLTSCGSTWTMEGNQVIINKAGTVTEVPKGTLYILPDSLNK